MMVVDRFLGNLITLKVEVFYIEHVLSFLDPVLMYLDVMLDEVAPRLGVYSPEYLLDVCFGFTGWHALGLLLRYIHCHFVITAHFVLVGNRSLMLLDSQEKR